LILRIGAFAVVMVCWVAFGIGFGFRKKPPASEERKREGKSVLGIVLQGVAYALVWAIQRRTFTPIAPLPPALDAALSIAAAALAVGSVWLSLAAVKTLGKQWSFAARLVEDHELITEGPYRLVRNPIYAGMLGKMVATGLVVSHWTALVVAVPIFLAGTMIRVRSEERLMRDAFGAKFDDYARRVPALIPLPRR
jgi:protein-S-isoprenylcysteine O-methyltransferase Ste14